VDEQQGGLTHLHSSGNSFTPRPTRRQTASHKIQRVHVYRSRDGTVCSGTLNRGLSDLRTGHFTNYTTTTGSCEPQYSRLPRALTERCGLEPDGVSAMSQKGWRTYTGQRRITLEDVNCLLQDSTRTLWIGTAEGLAYLSDEHVHVPRGVPDSLHAPIFGIEEDKNGWLWIATSSKVLHLNRSSLVKDAIGDADVR